LPDDFFSQYLPQRFSGLAGFEGLSSSGSVLFSVPAVGLWAFRLQSGQLIQGAGEAADALVRITIPEASFEPIMVRGSERLATLELSAERQMLAFRALTLDAERAAQIRAVIGSVCFALVDGADTHRVYVTPGSAEPNLARPECEVSCEAEAFWSLQTGAQNPLELWMNGKIRIAGDAQIPMALSSLFL
jgi:putative sterol carrier protein